MDDPQRRAWDALGLGPAWALRPERSARVAFAGSDDVLPAIVDGPAADPVDGGAAPADAPTEVPVVFAAPAYPDVVPAPASELDWSSLQAAVAACTACALHVTRRNTVFGSGAAPARWMLIGEAPGAEEDASGEPFVGQAGRLLDQMLAAIGVDRAREAFIANVLKCRPPRNRDPQPDEVQRCSPYLARQIELVAPRVLVVLGRFAAQTLLRTDASIASLRGRVHGYQDRQRRIPVVVTYHPAYLLRTPADKARAWADLCLARAAFDEAEAAAGAGASA